MIRIFDRLHKFDSTKGDLGGWSYRIAVNESLRLIRKNSSYDYDDIESVNTNDYALGFEEELNSQESLELLDHLKGSQRVVFNLFFVEGYNHKEIGEQLGIPEVTSRTTYFRAKEKLQKIYKEHYG